MVAEVEAVSSTMDTVRAMPTRPAPPEMAIGLTVSVLSASTFVVPLALVDVSFAAVESLFLVAVPSALMVVLELSIDAAVT